MSALSNYLLCVAGKILYAMRIEIANKILNQKRWLSSRRFFYINFLPSLLLASSTPCSIEAFKVKDKPIWGIQFHPEISAKKAVEIFIERPDYFKVDGLNIDMEIKKGFRKYYPRLAEIIISNFVNFNTDKRYK